MLNANQIEVRTPAQPVSDATAPTAAQVNEIAFRPSPVIAPATEETASAPKSHRVLESRRRRRTRLMNRR